MGDGMPRRHPRAADVQRATWEVHGVLGRWRVANTTSDVEVLIALTAVQSDVVRALAGEPSTGAVGPYGGLAVELMQVQEQHGMTPVELLQALLLFGVEMSKYLLRLERHPDDPGKPADEA